jgi:2-phosphoglycolate phosphatase
VPDFRARAVVFDLDGTLIDSRADIAAAANVALATGGRPQLSVDEISRYVGDGAKLLLARAAGLPPDAAELEPMIAAFLEHYAANATVHTRLMAHAGAVLDTLGPDYELALLTNKPRVTTDAVLRELGLTERFRVVVAGGDLPQKKPHPLPFRHIAGVLGCETTELVMVGDGPQDILGARAAGSMSVGVEGGFSSRETLLDAMPEVVLPNLGELPPWLARERGRERSR